MIVEGGVLGDKRGNLPRQCRGSPIEEEIVFLQRLGWVGRAVGVDLGRFRYGFLQQTLELGVVLDQRDELLGRYGMLVVE